MDIFRRAIKRSPNVLRDKKSRHEKLPEGWNENKDFVSDGITFYMKYLGSTLVEEAEEGQSYADGAITKALQNIIAMAKTSGKKLKKVALTASPKGIHIIDMVSKELVDEISIFRISFCSADKNFDKVFAFMARNSVNETMECHAYLCAKSKIAQAVTLSVSKAFEVANEKWSSENQGVHSNKENGSQRTKMLEDNSGKTKLSSKPKQEKNLEIPKIKSPSNRAKDKQETEPTQSTSWQSFEDENLDDVFSRLAENRSRGLQTFSTDLCQEDLDDSVTQYFDSNRCLEEFSRTKSVEDLLCL